MTPEEQWETQAQSAEHKVVMLMAAYEAGQLLPADVTEASAAAIYSANVMATRIADLAVTAWLLAQIRLSIPPLGLLPPANDQNRISRAIETILETDDAMPKTARSARIARSEPLNRGRQAYHEALRARGVQNWRRIVQPDACESCSSMARDVYPIERQFFDHPHCRCSLAPEVPKGWGDRVRAEQLQLRRTFETASGPVRLSTGLAFT